jgi:hypothetical protein
MRRTADTGGAQRTLGEREREWREDVRVVRVVRAVSGQLVAER